MSVWLHGVQRNEVLFIWNGTAFPLVVKPLTSTVVTFNRGALGTTSPSAEPRCVFFVIVPYQDLYFKTKFIFTWV